MECHVDGIDWQHNILEAPILSPPSISMCRAGYAGKVNKAEALRQLIDTILK